MVELGQFTLVLAHFLSSYAVIVDLLGVWRKNDGLMKSGRNATISCMLCLSVAIAVLLTLPLVNWFMPVVAAAFMLHRFETLRGRADAV